MHWAQMYAPFRPSTSIRDLPAISPQNEQALSGCLDSGSFRCIDPLLRFSTANDVIRVIRKRGAHVKFLRTVVDSGKLPVADLGLLHNAGAAFAVHCDCVTAIR